MPDSGSDKINLLKSLSINKDARDEGTGENFGWVSVLGALLLGILLGGAALYFTHIRTPEDSPVVKVAAKAVPDASGAPSITPKPVVNISNLIASGYVIARRQATVAAEVTGRVTTVLVEEGQRVEEGAILATLDDVLISADLATARSRTQAAMANARSILVELEDAKRILARTTALAAQNYASHADLTRTQTRVMSLEAQLANAQANIRTAKSDVDRIASLLDKYTIRAPFTGVVVDKNAQAGEIISPVSAGGGFTRTGICTIVDMGSLEIEVDVNEAFIGRVRDGQMVDAILDAYPDWTAKARVIATVPTANRDKATVRVRIALLEKDPRILPEMAVKVTFREDLDAL